MSLIGLLTPHQSHHWSKVSLRGSSCTAVETSIGNSHTTVESFKYGTFDYCATECHYYRYMNIDLVTQQSKVHSSFVEFSAIYHRIQRVYHHIQWIYRYMKGILSKSPGEIQ